MSASPVIAGALWKMQKGASCMARRCELTGKAVQVGNRVSHANNKSKHRFLPNLCQVSLLSETLGRGFTFRVAARAIKTVEHRGGLDAFLIKARDEDLSLKARRLKRRIEQKAASSAA
jgi:large subunit ribosomal protein L28